MANRRTKSPEGPRGTQIKFYATTQFKAEVDAFLDDHPELGSMGDFGLAAFRYFMRSYTDSGFTRTRDGFPALHAAEAIHRYEARGRPTQNKKGHGSQ